MSSPSSISPISTLKSLGESSWWLGIALVGLLAVAGTAAAHLAWAQYLGLSAFTLAIIFGIVAGNTFFPAVAARIATGVDYSKSTLLRVGIILYGFRITFQQITSIGWDGILIDALMVSMTFLLAVQLGTRVFKLDRKISMLIGAGSAICGAAAVIATEPVVRGQAHRVSVAVATVVVFGTLAMFVYPLLYPHLGLSERAYGIFAGSTIHEVAQVMAAGKSVSDNAAATAVTVKMLRVLMLAPFLLLLSGAQRMEGPGRKRNLTIPWFALIFIAASAVNSTHALPAAFVATLVRIDTVILTMAMAALGLRTHIGAIRQAGVKPLLLAAVLFIFLVVGGYAVNWTVGHSL